jgi:flagellar assembly protein FliH
MTAVKKFLFDTTFGASETCEGEANQKESEGRVPTFSQADVDAAREEGFAAGKEEGIRAAANTTEHRITESLRLLIERLSELFRMQDEANTDTARNAITVAITIARKMFPDLASRNALGEVERVAKMAMEKVLNDSPVVVRVNPELRDPLAERIDGHTAGTAAEGRITVSGDADLPVGDCRIEWRDGGAERDADAMWKDIDEIIERNMGGAAETSDPEAGRDRAEAARDGAPEAPGESAQGPTVPHPQDGAEGETDENRDVSQPAAEGTPDIAQPGGPAAVAGEAGKTPAEGAEGGGDAAAGEPRAEGAEGDAGNGRDDDGDGGVHETPADTGPAGVQETTTTTAGG